MARIFKPNSEGIGEILKSSEVARALDAAARATLGRMQANCPSDSGDLAADLEVWDDVTDRVVKRIGSRHVYYAAIVEADTGFMQRSL